MKQLGFQAVQGEPQSKLYLTTGPVTTVRLPLMRTRSQSSAHAHSIAGASAAETGKEASSRDGAGGGDRAPALRVHTQGGSQEGPVTGLHGDRRRR